MKFAWPFILQILAFGVAFAEVMIPSFGLLTLLCMGLGAYSWYFIFTELPTGAAYGFGLFDLISIPIAIFLGFKYLGHSPISHQVHVGMGSGMEEKDREWAKLVGQIAIVEAPLRPSGKIRIGADLYEAQISGEFVERAVQVRITGLAGSYLLVEKL